MAGRERTNEYVYLILRIHCGDTREELGLKSDDGQLPLRWQVDLHTHFSSALLPYYISVIT